MADALVYAIPLYEPVIAGNPFYIWIIMILGAIVVLMGVAFWTEVYTPMQPVWGFRATAKAKVGSTASTLAIVRTMNGKIWMEGLEYIASVFSSLTLPLKWILTVPVNGQMGSVNIVDVCDDWNIVHNLDIDYAIVEIIHRWNEHAKNESIYVKIPDPANPEKLVNSNELDQIYDYKSFEVKLMDGTLDKFVPDGVKLPPFRFVDLNTVRRYLPKWQAAHHSGYINQKVDERKEEDPEKNRKLMYIFAGGCIAIFVVCGLGYLLLTSIKCPVCS